MQDTNQSQESTMYPSVRKVAIVTTTWHKDIVARLLEAAKTYIFDHSHEDVEIYEYEVAGAFEIPQMLEVLARSEEFDCMIPLGCLIKGETSHFDWIAQTLFPAIDQIARRYAIPISVGVLTCENKTQAIERSGGKQGNKGIEASQAALGLAESFDGLEL